MSASRLLRLPASLFSMLLISLFFFLAPLTTLASPTLSPSGFIYYSQVRLTWFDARLFCQAQNMNGLQGELAIIRNADEQNEVLSLTQTQSWIGLVRNKPGGDFFWVDGERMTYSNFFPGEPNNVYNIEACTTFSNLYGNGQWFDYYCLYPLPVICRFESNKPNPAFVSPTGLELFAVVKLNFKDAQTFCETPNYLAQKGEIVTIKTAEQQQLVENLVFAQDWIWLGLARKTAGGPFYWVDDGSPLSGYSNWEVGEPNNVAGVENCVIMKASTGTWFDVSCTASNFPFVCQFNTTTYNFTSGITWYPPSPTPQPTFKNLQPSSPSGFKFYPQTQLTFYDSIYFCEKQTQNGVQGELAIIRSFAEQIEAMSVVDQSSPAWIGLWRTQTNGPTFQWLDGSAPGFTAWAVNEPDNAMGVEACTSFNSFGDGAWNDKYCLMKLPILCRFEANKTTQATANLITPNGYQYFNTRMSWMDAKQFCSTPTYDGRVGELAIINSALQQFEVSTIAPEIVWIGVNQPYIGGLYSWVDGSQLTYSNWHSGEPNNPLGCGIANFPNGLWYDQTCSRTYAFICKYNMTANYSNWTLRPTSLPTSKPTFAPTLFISSSGFKVFPTQLTWYDARQFCQQQSVQGVSGELGVIRNVTEQNEVFSLVSPSTVWLGLYRPRLSSNIFSWVTGEGLNFSNWQTGEPNNINGNEGCVQFNAFDNNGRWNDANCLTRLAVLCRFDATKGLPSAKPYLTSPSKFEYFNTKMDWNDAISFCSSTTALNNTIQGELAVIRSAAENQEAMNITLETAWMGLQRSKQDGKWYWDGMQTVPVDLTVNYSNWQQGEPNNVGNGENCTAIGADGTWADRDCNLQFPVLCRYETKATSRRQLRI